MATGRPTKLTPEVHAAIVALVEQGNYPETAAQCEGISRTAFYEWMERGRRGEAPFADFADAVTRARAKAERSALDTIRAGFADEQRGAERAQWFLERTAADRFGRRDKVVVENTVRDELDRVLSKLEAALSAEEFDRVLRIIADDGAGTGAAAVAGSDASDRVH